MINTNSIIMDVWDHKTGKLDVLVNAEYAKSFHQFLTKEGINCSPISEAICQGTGLYRDKKGRLQQEQQCTVHTFDADCAPEDFRKRTDRWCLAIFYRKPNSN